MWGNYGECLHDAYCVRVGETKEGEGLWRHDVAVLFLLWRPDEVKSRWIEWRSDISRRDERRVYPLPCLILCTLSRSICCNSCVVAVATRAGCVLVVAANAVLVVATRAVRVNVVASRAGCVCVCLLVVAASAGCVIVVAICGLCVCHSPASLSPWK